MNTTQEEKKYVIKEITSTEKVVTKNDYVHYLSNRVNFLMEEYQNAKLKVLKAEKSMDEALEKLMVVSNELDALVSSEQHDRIMEYARWRYKEMHPLKAKLLGEKP